MTGIEEVYDAYITQSNKILDSSENRKESKDEVENLYYKIAKSNTKQNLNDVIDSCSIQNEIKAEKAKFLELLRTHSTNGLKFTNNTEFWVKNEKELKNLYKLALILNTMQSSTAFLERSFSVSSLISTKRSSNLDPTILQSSAMLKLNYFLFIRN